MSSMPTGYSTIIVYSDTMHTHLFCYAIIIQNGGKIVYAMDALFGLPRKKSAGISYCDPLAGNLFFGDQSTVDEFVYESKKVIVTDVS